MNNFGVTENGFTRKRLPEQLREIQEQAKRYFGSEIDTTPDSVLGVLSAIEAERFAAMWELVEAVYLQMYPMSATGSNLDRAVSFTGVKRLSEQPSTATVVWYGEEGSVIDEYTAVKNKQTGQIYYADEKITLSKTNAYDVEIKTTLTDIIYDQEISVIVNGIRYSYRTDRESLVYAIKNLANKLASIPFLVVDYTDTSIRLTAEGVSDFSIDEGSDFTVSELGCLGSVSTNGPSLDLPEKNTLSELITIPLGISHVNNMAEGIAGRFAETDSELYQRYPLGVWRTGAGTVQSIRANVLEVQGGAHCTVYENASNSELNGMPPHSIHVVVRGGLDEQIANTILAFKPAGITTFGSTSMRVRDSQDVFHSVSFSRPRKTYIWCKVRVSTFSDQNESVKTGYLLNVIDKILSYGKELTIGSDVILQRLMGKCVEVEGVNGVSIELGKTYGLDEDEPAYQTENITIQPDEEAVFHKSIIRIS
ncbi:hypothetical protein [Actinobacillus pleuropneumoniae]|uniref:hypothetical protein n=1 Tax=Actinobacillus pleuropneumoniae TaxID=715 RepID=UPI003B025BC3